MNSSDIAKTISTAAVATGAAVTSYFTNDVTVWIIVGFIAWLIWRTD